MSDSSPLRRRWPWVAAALAVVLGLSAGFVAFQRSQEATADADRAARAAAQAVVDSWTGENPAQVMAGAPFTDPDAAQTEYDALVAGLGGARPAVELGEVTRTDDRASAVLTLTWPFGPDGWSYPTTFELTGRDGATATGDWTATWAPSLVHPELAEGDVLEASRLVADRADVLGADGTPIVTAQPVVRVGVQPSRVSDLATLTATLSELLDVDAAPLSERVTAASPDAFVDVITLRQSDFDALDADLRPLPGTVFAEATQPLAPTREFARALLGTVGPATAELVEQSQGQVVAGDTTGLSGVQRSFDDRLAGMAGVLVERVRGERRSELFAVEPVPGTPVTLTLDPAVQLAADAALATSPAGPDAAGNGNAALVAVDVTTGAVLAVANTPASGTNRAMTGRYPPGSTFKAISTQALLAAGITPDQVVPCPATQVVDGRSFRNFEGGALGDEATFAEDFAASCNTAFVSLADQLGDDALTAAAAPTGLGLDWGVGMDAFTGDVPQSTSAVDKAAATIGQGRTVVSPLAMAVATGTIARGEFVSPTLVLDPAGPDAAVNAPPPVADLGQIRELMRSVVTSGTAQALADVPGAEVFAKTGTAEYGTGDPPPTHAWTIGFQGDVAFAVLVENGASGGRAAVPVAEAFLRALAG